MIHCAASTPPPRACWMTGSVRLTAEASMKASPDPSTVPIRTRLRARAGRSSAPKDMAWIKARWLWAPRCGMASRRGRDPAVEFEGDAVGLGQEELADAAVRRFARLILDAGRVQPPPGVLVVVDGEGEVVQRRPSRGLVLALHAHQMHDVLLARIEPDARELEVRPPADRQAQHLG